ncbi:DUF2490 domain-containing protein [Mucilaginibacter robiniae]|uniref:DUF2490 domain-containing protein n=1 Tax=Mucilaginibacter robiniae TaxID=2728022 RepID=A0A7L5DWY6_9SPHI|nr:DUF2490 domain-containing protein [Mucilaginibacter robiniae]QJD94499.1 DUF2490 domain-containing protein [Mucilaginibacter robiniae]
MKKALLLTCIVLLYHVSYAQLTENTGWLFLNHQQKLNEKFDFLFDAQLRSANNFDYLTTLLLRGGLSYNFNKKHSAAVGYVYKGDWEHDDMGEVAYTLENRLFEQYLYQFKIKHTEFQIRARLEQRFVKEEQVDFSQRARAFISMQLPLLTDSAFTRGWFLGLQNELFVNVQHNERVNNSFFDQNRPYLSLGYRLSKKADLQLGYLYWLQKEEDATYQHNVLQITIATNF